MWWGPAAGQGAAVGKQCKPELLRMGCPGHGSLANVVMGSVATQGLERTKVPVLLVR